MDSSSTIEDPNSPDLKLLCVYAFDTLITGLTKKEIPNCFPESLKNKSFPLFVTWTKGKTKDLRGCIGTFVSNDLETNLKSFSLIAALNDRRFPPIGVTEIPKLNCGVSLLINFEAAKDCYDWEVGKHGIQISFGHYSATFLPEVPIEHHMDKNTTLEHLIRKAGYMGQLEDVEKKIKLRRYQSIKLFMTYEEYLNFRK
jgi:uncharacterized protein (TIGR00296 family)